MPTFDTPAPISVSLNLLIGDVRIRAGDRTDTIVEVVAADPDNAEDVRAAEGTRVEYAGGALTVTAPKPWSRFRPGRSGGTIRVTIDVPAGSELHGRASIVDVSTEGRLGTCSLHTSVGALTLDGTGPLDLSTTGPIDVRRADGPVTVTGVGEIRLGTMEGAATVKNTNGDTRIDAITGPVRCRSANGRVTIGSAGADVDVTTANGGIRVDEVVRGTVSLETANGPVEIGIRPGTAARLDVRSSFGRVRNTLEATDGPGDAAETATVRARTAYGDIHVGRPQNVREN